MHAQDPEPGRTTGGEEEPAHGDRAAEHGRLRVAVLADLPPEAEQARRHLADDRELEPVDPVSALVTS